MLALMFTTATAMAVPAKRGMWKSLTKADGTEVRALLVGDENGHYWKGEDGKAYLLTDDGLCETVNEQTVMAKAKKRRQLSQQRRSKRMARRAAVGSVGSFTGKKKALIILVNFSMTKFAASHNQALFMRIANEEGYSEGDFKGSMSDYFKAQSRGQFELDFDVVGPVKLSHDYSYYGRNDSNGEDMRPGQMVIEAVEAAMDEVEDWAQYDWDGDGEVDQVYVIYAGKGEADGGGSSTIWPHEYSLSAAEYYGDGTGPVTVADGLVVDTYACGPELDSYSSSLCGIGTMCHEFSHCLGFPDFYDTDYSGGQGMGNWDLMDNGAYNGDGFQPAGYTSYERWCAGWLEPTVLEDENVTVEDMKALEDGGESYVIYNKGNRNEFFLLENRQYVGWDASLPGFGLLILHVDYSKEAWQNNTPNDNPSRQRMTWMAADNKYDYTMYEGSKYFTDEGMAKDTYPYSGNNSFDKSTTPAAKFYNKNSDGTYFMDSSIKDIDQLLGGSISFRFVAHEEDDPGDDPGVEPGVKPSKEGTLFYESFDSCNGKGGNDDLWSGQIASGEFLADNEGWVALGGRYYGANKCARFGNSSVVGEATTPHFTLNEETKLSFKAGAWDAKNDATTLQLSVNGGTVEPAEVTMKKGEFTSYEVTVTGQGSVSITFATTKGRFFLDEVTVADPTATAIRDTRLNVPDSHTYYNLKGQRVDQPTKGLYIVDGKKVFLN